MTAWQTQVRRAGQRGTAIMAALGVGPSAKVGMATRFLLEQVLDAPELNTPERLREVLKSWQASAGA